MKTASKNIEKCNLQRFFKDFRPFLENFRLKMADFLTLKKHSHVISQFYCKLGADYENLKIFHFWSLLGHFWGKNGPNFEIFRKKFFFQNFLFFDLSDSESKSKKKFLTKWSPGRHLVIFRTKIKKILKNNFFF